jgi:hypothetical protein
LASDNLRASEAAAARLLRFQAEGKRGKGVQPIALMLPPLPLGCVFLRTSFHLALISVHIEADKRGYYCITSAACFVLERRSELVVDCRLQR